MLEALISKLLQFLVIGMFPFTISQLSTPALGQFPYALMSRVVQQHSMMTSCVLGFMVTQSPIDSLSMTIIALQRNCTLVKERFQSTFLNLFVIILVSVARVGIIFTVA